VNHWRKYRKIGEQDTFWKSLWTQVPIPSFVRRDIPLFIVNKYIRLRIRRYIGIQLRNNNSRTGEEKISTRKWTTETPKTQSGPLTRTIKVNSLHSPGNEPVIAKGQFSYIIFTDFTNYIVPPNNR
jgi:hypothetical protein